MEIILLILRDLTNLGWQLRTEGGQLWVRAYDSSSELPTKNDVRRQLLFGRSDQLKEQSTRAFIQEMESPPTGAKYDSVLTLVADGRKLADTMRTIASLPREARPEVLREKCKPYLQLAEAGVKDQYTNLDLQKIWRYFRYTWSSRFRRPPGRLLQFLVRDAAQPHHPIMAITALSNTVMQLSARDEWLGWTLKGLLAVIKRGEASDTEVLDALRRRLHEELSAVYTEDLGFTTSSPPQFEEALSRELLEKAHSALRARSEQLREGKATRIENLSDESFSEKALSPLFTAKRAISARALLHAIQDLADVSGSLEEVIKKRNVKDAIEFSLRRIKQHHASTSIMELSTCGAVPPYSPLLGGKLACLMMMSPVVVRLYKERYSNKASIIASQMAGRSICKEPSLALLCTTSLYPERSSQYNRIKLPKNTVPGQRGALGFHELGLTRGHGSSNLSAETEQSIADAAEAARAYQNINFIFGEGQSPKLRQTREGLEALGLGESDLIHHGARRIIYTAPLALNFRRFLLGVDEAIEYALSFDEDEEWPEEYWRTRWLAKRIEYLPALEATAALRKDSVALSQEWNRPLTFQHKFNF